jgi:hypothetical protein
VLLPFSKACRLSDAVAVYNRDPLEGEEISEGRALLGSRSVTQAQAESHHKAKAVMDARIKKGWIKLTPRSIAIAEESSGIAKDGIVPSAHGELLGGEDVIDAD